MSIHVAMATYNGEKYVREQIESICGQTLRPDKIIIVDDGSSDKTIEIIKALQVTSPVEIELHVNKNNMGVIKTFDKALSLCDADYIALADQDDVWLSNKLDALLQVMKDIEQDIIDVPCLVYSDLNVVGADLKMQNESHLSITNVDQIDLGKPIRLLIERNHAPGCSMLINNSLKEMALPIPLGCRMHDYWLSIIAGAVGRMSCCKEPLMLFRRHGSNVTEVIGKERRIDYLIRKLSYFPRFIPVFYRIISGAYNCRHFNEQLKLFSLLDERLDKADDLVHKYVENMDKGGTQACRFFMRESLQLRYRHEFYLSLLSKSCANFWSRFSK